MSGRDRGWRGWNSMLLLTGLALVIAILILLAPLVWKTSTINTVVSNCSTTAIESLACSDYDPCTLDLQTTSLCGQASPASSNSSDCVTYSCTHQPMADGSCCNRDDVCSAPNPLKQCINGQCVSPVASDCFGYCNGTIDCVPELFPFKANVQYEATCVAQSCSALVCLPMPINSVDQLVDVLSNSTQLNLSNCLTGVFGSGADMDSECPFAAFITFKCAPFNFNATSKKRADVVDDDAARHRVLAYPGVRTTEQYDHINSIVRGHYRSMANARAASRLGGAGRTASAA